MGLIELVLIALGLSMDAFAVSVCKGLGMKRLKGAHMVVIACFFGGFQALMPLIGWALGMQFQAYIENIDHWVAFVLLAAIGAHMLWDTLRGGEGDAPNISDDPRPDIRELFMLALATSIDALAVGITFAFLQVSIIPSVLTIGSVTFVLALGGVWA
ncbi:MAG: manganese efflux pump MntP family protein, partial [Coriobacteriaceae bacterium]|nr:manganese efflux pump MntP family protein [Coriobacteriaceae bacterium]